MRESLRTMAKIAMAARLLRARKEQTRKHGTTKKVINNETTLSTTQRALDFTTHILVGTVLDVPLQLARERSINSKI
jgi:hypothetical protein